MAYLPLEFLSSFEDEATKYSDIQELMDQAGVKNVEEITEDEFIHFAGSPDFCDPEYCGKFEPLNTALMTNPQLLSWVSANTGIPVSDYQSGKYTIETEWRDFLLSPCLWDQWAKNKQVYKPDKDFAQALVSTKNLYLTKDQIEHLPTKAFYIDLEDCDTDPAKGAFVFVINEPFGASFACYLLTQELLFFSFYGGGIYDENGILQMDLNKMEENRNKDFEVYTPQAEKVGLNIKEKDKGSTKIETKVDRIYTTNLALQMLCYLTSQKPDISENPTTKQTYKPSAKVRNKFSEVQKWDVGVRFGTALRKSQSAAAQDRESSESREITEGQGKQRKSPIPHFRCAHWQRYWVGEGRKICEVKWIEPVFVGIGETAKDVVIHKVYR